MDIASQYADVYTDFQGLSRLRAEAANNDKESLRKVAGQFEALFIQMMLKSMRDANLGEGIMDSEHVKTYQSMYDQQIALDLSRSGSLGLADLMVRQLTRGPGSGGADTDSGAQPLAPPAAGRGAAKADAAPGGAAAGTYTAVHGNDWRPASPDDFVRELLPHARRAAAELGTSPEVLIAQAALETGWGRQMIRHQDGGNSYNLFGIKADAGWQGARAVTDTIEFRDGLMRKERAAFRAYDSLSGSFSDYVHFLKSNPRYRAALEQAADPAAFTRALSQAGYATDPRYHDKIKSIMDGSRIQDALITAPADPQEPVS